MCAILATSSREEVIKKIENLEIDFSAFQKKPKGLSLMRKVVRLFTKGSIIEMECLQEFLRQACGDQTFKEAYDRTGWIVSIVVAGDHHEEYKVLNYMTAPNVLIWSASLASCSVPGLYKPTKIMCKDNYGKIKEWFPISKEFIDGTLGRDLPKRKMAELFNANHFIVSQANPIIVHFIDQRRKYMNSRGKWLQKTLYYIVKLIISEISHRIQQLISMKIIPKALVRYVNLLIQDYSGHITIKFSPKISDYANVLTNPNKEICQYFRDQGEKTCFTEMSRVRVFMKIEKAISQAIRNINDNTGPQNATRLSVIKEDKEESIKTEKEKDKSMSLNLDLNQDEVWKYIHNFDDNKLNTPEYTPPHSRHFDFGYKEITQNIERVKSTDSFSSLTSVGGTLR